LKISRKRKLPHEEIIMTDDMKNMGNLWMNDLWNTRKDMEVTADTDIIKKSLESERFFNLYKRCFPRSFKNEVI